MMVTCIKQHLSNIWSSIHERVKQHWDWFPKMCCLQKKACNSTRRSPGASKRGSVPKHGQTPSAVWTWKLPILIPLGLTHNALTHYLTGEETW